MVIEFGIASLHSKIESGRRQVDVDPNSLLNSVVLTIFTAQIASIYLHPASSTSHSKDLSRTFVKIFASFVPPLRSAMKY